VRGLTEEKVVCCYAQGPNKILVPAGSKALSPMVVSDVVRATCGCKRHEVKEG
jgi:hypothetical protein